jgi:PKD repeat protein
MKYIFTIPTLLICSVVFGQGQTKRVLFIGNSYTYVNNLPQMAADVTASTGDNLIFDSNAIAGETFHGHFTSEPATISKISVGNWDYVVLQQQSEAPSLPPSEVDTGTFLYAHRLDSLINAKNPCAETVFYMTWGWKNGDNVNCPNYPNWQYVCTYQGMDSLINLRYRMLADSNSAIVSPCGAVWHSIRQLFPAINLYMSDNSHPSVAGTYANACCFYTTLFRKDPSFITFNSTLSAADAANIRSVVKTIVYNNLTAWHVGQYDPMAAFTQVNSGNQVTFTNASVNASTYTWSFGDGSTSTTANPTHTYTASGTYSVTLIAGKCGMKNTVVHTVSVSTTGVPFGEDQDVSWNVYPNPATSTISIHLTAAGDIHYKIFNITGEEIQNGKINSSGSQINITNLSDGLYFIQVYDKNASLGRKKFIKTVN